MEKKKQTLVIPRDIEGVDERCSEIDAIHMSTGWERAALLASVVRLPGKPGPRPRDTGNPPYLTAGDYAKRRVPGLLDEKVVRLYVQRWLDANAGVYPELGQTVFLPKISWPPVDPNDAGSRVSSDPDKAVQQLVEKHGPEVAARAIIDSPTPLHQSIRREHVRREVERYESSGAGQIERDLRQHADEAHDAYERFEYGTDDVYSQRVVRLTQDLADNDYAYSMGGDGDPAAYALAIRNLAILAQGIVDRINGTSTQWSERDQAFLEEMGIDR